eukprot:CAMPEP_0198311710 /NCGR_PEP_ID=MMETSP1450-20131203/3350_1 /TAXON_ID=753684 ORGANISM="Madagascaria erythrocladiodes, Strain CCMP3234" /NCGR_SAMPLE_ID=MMETSP1450 /ASSEMBLY_ACC=CAM_ASM_001115 /LENGTH=147 /DNA_ID=CAMNT_0044014617 /DNA_START=86 /DNA_END=525 /DNA_ORIENTATION=+
MGARPQRVREAWSALVHLVWVGARSARGLGIGEKGCVWGKGLHGADAEALVEGAGVRGLRGGVCARGGRVRRGGRGRLEGEESPAAAHATKAAVDALLRVGKVVLAAGAVDGEGVAGAGNGLERAQAARARGRLARRGGWRGGAGEA